MNEIAESINIHWLEYLDKQTVFGNPIMDWIIAVFVFFLCITVFWWFRKRVLTGLETLSKRTENGSDDFLVQTIETLPKSFYRITALFIATQFVILSESTEQIIDIAFIVLAISQIGFTLGRVVLFFLQKNYLTEKESGQTMAFLRIIVKVAVSVIVILMILNNLGVEITPLITSLGIIGIAVAFALQNILEDLLSSISLIIDKPFIVGDFVEINGDSGTVKSIGIKTTRITTIRGEELVVANRKVTNETLRNYGKMDNRTITSSLIISYPDDSQVLINLPEKIEALFDTIERVDIQTVFLTSLEGRGAEFTYRYTIQSQEYVEYLEKQQQINFALLKMLEEQNLSVAAPVRVVNLQKEPT